MAWISSGHLGQCIGRQCVGALPGPHSLQAIYQEVRVHISPWVYATSMFSHKSESLEHLVKYTENMDQDSMAVGTYHFTKWTTPTLSQSHEGQAVLQSALMVAS